MVMESNVTPIIAGAVGFTLLLVLGGIVWWKLRNLASFKENQVIPLTDPTKINKFTRRATQAHKFRQQSRYKPSTKKKPPAQFSKLQAIYETDIINSIDEIDVENQANMVMDFDQKVDFHSSTPVHNINSKHTEELTIYNCGTSDDGSIQGSIKGTNETGSKHGSFASLNMFSLMNNSNSNNNNISPRRSRTGSAMIDIEDEKLEDISNVSEMSDRSFRFLHSR